MHVITEYQFNAPSGRTTETVKSFKRVYCMFSVDRPVWCTDSLWSTDSKEKIQKFRSFM